MAKRRISLEAIEERRLKEFWPCGWGDHDSAKALMLPGINKGKRLGKRPVSREGTLNSDLIRRSPGSSQHRGMDFVRAVYAEKTGQE
jgi:hypothetical protein